jgi:hypothetical protein
MRMMCQLSRTPTCTRVLLATAFVVLPPGLVRAGDDTGLSGILRRAGEYVRQFERDFAAVITDEVYEQEHWDGSLAQQHERRSIRSEMLFMRLPGQGLSWLTARNVLAVDGQEVPDSRERLDRAIKGGERGLVDRLRSVADEGARFNLGRVQRNFNDPVLALLFLDPDYQPRFKFTPGPEEDVAGVRARRVSFKERSAPTVIRAVGGKDVFTSGSVWIVAGEGIIARTELRANSNRGALSMLLRVEYRRDEKLGMWIPVRMTEHYEATRERDHVDCVATYSNPRRFETSGRVLAK